MILPAGLRTEDNIDQDNFVRSRKKDGISFGNPLQNNEISNRSFIEYIQKTTSATLISNADNLVEQKMSDNTINSSVHTEIITKNFTVTKSANISYLGMENENITTSYIVPTVCVNGTDQSSAPIGITNLSEIPAKEVIIVVLMLSLWIYAIHMTRRAWQRLLKE